ncbi:MAG: carbamoyltransferase [Nitrososphaerales archaeon]
MLAAVEEERFTRNKHAPGMMPENGIRYCLKEAGILIQDVDCVVFPGATYENFTEILAGFFKFRFKHSPPIRLVDHHFAHASSAFYVSGFDEAMVLTLDLSGDNRSTTLSYGVDGKITEITDFRKPNSLGLFYSIITEYLGFQYDNDEYKVMGLSAYGKPTYDLSWFLQSNGETGSYTFNSEYASESIRPGKSHPSRQLKLGNDKLWERLGQPRRKDEPITRHHEEMAASAQRHLEKVAVDLVTWLHRKTGSRNLCIAGGVGLNCVMNQRLRALPFIDQVFIQPAASDAGLALGGALAVAVENGLRFSKMVHTLYGALYSDEEIESEISKFKLPHKHCDDVAKMAAQAVSEGKIVGWFQGRMEYGPRALGARSILADPRDASMKDKVNELVKFREEFRPFAPAILVEFVDEYFVDGCESPFMILTFDVREDKKLVIPAVVHVDDTARVQTVDKKTNPLFHRLIQEFYKTTGVPVVLNTSFNIRGQPIVLNPQQAISTFYGTGMDCLAIGNYFLTKGAL